MPRNKYPEETVKRILDVSLELFLKRGYEHTSIQDIIDNLGGLTKGAIYHHFKSKEDIIFAVMDRIYGGHDAQWARILHTGEGLNGLERLRELIRSSVNNPGQLEMFGAAPDFLKNPKMLVMQIKSIMEESVPRYVLPIIEQGVADGSIKTDYPRQLAEAILLLINLWLSPMVYYVEPEIMRCRLALFKELLLGIGVDLIDEQMTERFMELCRIYGEKK